MTGLFDSTIGHVIDCYHLWNEIPSVYKKDKYLFLYNLFAL